MREPCPDPFSPRRRMCASCLRPQSACICHWITPVAAAAEVLILQHPLEVANPKGSARLLHLSLPRSRLAGGETFAEADLRALLHAPWRDRQADAHANQAACYPVLLYPESAGEVVSDCNRAALDAARLRDPARLRLVVLDATWRKSRKMLHLNPLLQALPRLALTEVPASRYLIRKAHLPHQLSTLEAACLALSRLEGDAQKFESLLHAFDGFIGQQLGYRPR
ncbi:tRNA-uridine aminocarboxypropyltransferase [Janthinobacterium sp. 17J80-10]|uniref:tRNA-uridine aminocarboxypropyltransferase n=1 Tax=Janthinobacterium sp. 17J80-10 TaxID=2497863 RepID=UPI001005A2DB|nr:tRNA-uridine aminocarboxypropyltransferase [Janthinobacterium sp. 17J80-10]QAU35462.1 DTW domain-containing protein [Janthinobacterium sp. 17J80-10]